MDLSSVSSAVAAITAAKDLGKAMIGLRDFNQVATTVSEINDKLLKAQESLFAHNTQLMQLQDEHFKTREELRELKETLSQRGRYSLFEISSGIFVYRVNINPEPSKMSDPLTSEPLHYVCQPCFDKGIKVVLQKGDFYGFSHLECSNCKEQFPLDEGQSNNEMPSF